MLFYLLYMTPIPFKIYRSITEIDETTWNGFVPSSRFFMRYAYFKALEKSVKQIAFRYLIAYSNNEPIGIATFQIVDFKGEFLHKYLPDSNKIVKSLLHLGLKLIDVKLITLGNLVSTGDKGWKFDTDNETALNTIFAGIREIQDSIKDKTSGVLICKEGTEKNKDIFLLDGFHPYRAEDEMHLYINKNWSDFNAYEKAIHSKYRVRMHKVFQVGKDLTLKPLEEKDIIAYKNEIQALFDNVLHHVKFKLVELDVDYFIQMKKNLQEQFHVLGYFYKDKLVAFISYFDVSHDIDVHYLGIDYHFNQEFKLYNRILYDMTKIGILEKKEMVCFGRTAHEIKSTVGAVPEKVYNYLRINNTLFNPLVPFFLKRLVPQDWIQRNPFK